MKIIINWILLSSFSWLLLSSCCDKCDIQLTEEQLVWLPYQDHQQIVFTNDDATETITLVHDQTRHESQDKDCERINERTCHRTATQLLRTDDAWGNYYKVEISKFKDSALLLSVHFITSDDLYEYIGLVRSSYHLEEDLIPDVDSLTIGTTTFYEVFKVEGVNDPVVADEPDAVVEFYFTQRQGLIQFKTRDNTTWSVSG